MMNALLFWLCAFMSITHPSFGLRMPTKRETIFPKKVTLSGQLSDSLSTQVNFGKGDGLHETTCQYHITFEGKTYVIDLQLNVRLIGGNLTVEDGSNGKTTLLDRKLLDLSQYIGTAHIVDQPGEYWDAWFDIKDVMIGTIMTPDPITILPYDDGHIAYRVSASGFNQTEFCGVKDLSRHEIETLQLTEPSTNTFGDNISARNKRSVFDKTKYIETLFVVSADLFQHLGESVSAVTQAILRLANGVDCFFKPVGIRVIVHHVEYFNESNPFPINLTNTHQTFDNGELYARRRYYTDPDGSAWKNFDHVMLLNGASYVSDDGNTLGLARLFAMCTPNSFSYMAYNLQFGDHARVLVATHEIGHSIGLSHNDQYKHDCDCGDRKCIMDSTLRSNEDDYATKWSNCSKRNMKMSLLYTGGSCLLNVPEGSQLLQISSCGNKYLEAGEECDCGTVSECKSVCCNPLTCQLYDFAECDGSHSCCNALTCQIAAAGTLCRQTCDDECDLPEYCDGKYVTCPEDRHAEDGTLCNMNLDRCKGGYCLTHTRQCKHVFHKGVNITGSPMSCYIVLNRLGDKYGNCGVSDNGLYVPCVKESVACGKLFCRGSGLDTAHLTADTAWAQFLLTDGNICLTIMEPPLPGVFDYTYVKDGSACYGNLGICFRGTCYKSPSRCSSQCNGTCNDAGNCFCADGLAPPDCTSPGNGGSIDSGPPPITKPNCDSYNITNDREILSSDLEMELICGWKMEVRFNLCPFLVHGYTVEDLVILSAKKKYNPYKKKVTVPKQCVAKADPAFPGKKWRARITFDAEVCSRIPPTIDETHVITTARFRAIRGGDMDDTRMIARKKPEFIYDFKCKLKKTIYGQVFAKPEKLFFSSHEEANKFFSVGKSFFRDASYTVEINIGTDIIRVGDRVFVRLQLLESATNLVMQTVNCWISDSPQKSTVPVYYVIDNGCPASDLLGYEGANVITTNCESKETRFSFLAFSYVQGITKQPELYMHCNLKTCFSDVNYCSCAACNSQNRRKRSDRIETDGGRVATMGPLLFVENNF